MSVFEDKNQPANPERQFDPGHKFDLLVDGELSESDRRDLLVQLEREPDGWRRCALAFLEAQCWKAEAQCLKAEMRAPAAESTHGTEPVAQPVAQPAPDVSRFRRTERWQTWRQHAAMALTVAASVMIAFVVGKGLTGNGSVGPHSPDSSIVQDTKAVIPLPSQNAPNQNAAVTPTNNWEMVTLALPSCESAAAETYSVPAQHRETLDPDLLQQIPVAFPPQVQQALEQSGNRIVHKREIVPVQMDDGSRLVVPVDNVEIHYVGRQSF